MKQVRILVADDHEMIRRGISAVVAAHEGWTVCGEASNGREAVETALALHPDIVIMDLSMPELNGLEATRRIVDADSRIQVLILTMHDSEQLVHEVLKAGARGYILKSDAGHVLGEALESFCRHEPFFTSRVSEIMLNAYAHQDSQTAVKVESGGDLTSREREIVQLIAEGKSTKDVAVALNISVKTAETHRANLMRKLDAHSVSEVIRYAIRNHLVMP